MLRFFFSVVVVYFATVGVARAYSGLELLRGCNAALKMATGQHFEPQDAVNGGMCLGYVSGIMDVNQVVVVVRGRAMALFCAPERGLENEQAIRIVVKHLVDNPADLHQPARMSVVLALRRAFPCPGQ
jgi:hypothetical protein